jgi:Family of unknown function (DUF6519)
MATIDLSRSATDYRKHYTSVRAQMGRVLTDDDHNENERLHGEDMRRSRVDIIGPAGSPDDGFSIQNPRITGGRIDFDIEPGTFYLGGNRLTLENTEAFQVQSDWLNMGDADKPLAPGGARFDLVYLECWHQALSAVEDSELFEVALGGPDTSQRMKLMRRVHVFADSGSPDCQQPWATLTGVWSAGGLGTLDDQAELKVDTKLQVGFVPGPTGDLCTPAIAGGYLGADNQAIRVQLVDGASFTWGFDNAAPLYRVQIGNNANGQKRKITLLTEPKDQAHWPVSGQVIELLPWSALLPNQEKTSEVNGFLAKVDTSYDPDTKELFITTDVPAGFGENWLTRPDAANLQPEFFYLRVWNRGSDMASPPAIPFVNGTAVTLGNTGLSVTFTGNDHHPNDYWIIAARPESPNLVVPWLLEQGRGPHGIRRWFTPLAVIQWTPGLGGKVVHDCREKFPPLTHIRGCCTYTVGDGTHSYGDFTSIQKAIDALPPEGGEICIRPGIYKENFLIKNLHDVSIHGCGSHTLLEDNGNAAGPLINVQDSQRIAISNLAIQAPAVIGIQLTSTAAAEANRAGLDHVALHDLDISSRDVSAIDCRGGRWITIERNHLVGADLTSRLGSNAGNGLAPLVFVRADDVLIERNQLFASGDGRSLTPAGGLQIGGGSERVAIRRNLIQGGNGNGITLGSITWVSAGGVVFVAGGGGGMVVEVTGGFTTDANGCIVPDPTNQPPNDPNGNPMTPQSDGDLLDIRILDNDIFDMGECGISTLRFFDQNNVGFIVVRGLDVELNRILRCMQLTLGNNPFDPNILLGYGGVTLVAVDRFTLRDNLIEGNGNSFIDPICGVFILKARGFIAENNQILDNGPRVTTTQQPAGGPRGGILVLMAQTPFSGIEHVVRHTGFPAARITGNTVVHPMGRALALLAQGLVSVNNNEFTSLGVFPTQFDSGVTVFIFNLGFAYEIAQFAGFTTMGVNQPSVDVASKLGTAPGVGGEILFNDNQVLLAPLDANGPAILTSVEVISYDDVSFEGNQCEARMGQEFLIVNGFVIGWSTRMIGNRFEEAVTLGLSAFTVGVFNNTSMNQGTRCFLVLGTPALTVNNGNKSLATLLAISTGTTDPCAVFQRRMSTTFGSFGLGGV